ncbi:hypothetical protein [Micromonospora sp. NBC_01796]|uniref:hypothetical protein n=1 Tax=Micromonospora sp. NBC_01796 TaxID=2975987 RepID=UPI002DD8D084|nr:hypothetical protein [Micromonospora sp. NBC_01796]WSA87962.1 hypothetical protein OIE47_10325 [Micromonospora sp. NBC_01796]
MTASVGDVVAQLRAVLESLDAAVVTALRAQADADQAKAQFTEAATGTDHSMIRAAITASQAASEKVARYARLLAKANESLTTYLNTIAPGSAPTHQASNSATPTGEQIIQGAEQRARRADLAWRKQVQKADDAQDSLKTAETNAKDVFKYLKQQTNPPGESSTGTVAPEPPPAQERPQIDHPITAAVMAAGALAVVAKSIWNHGKNRRARKRDDDDQA